MIVSSQDPDEESLDDIFFENVDLSGGNVASSTLAKDSIALRELSHRHGLQQNIFSCAISIAVVLYIAAIVFAGWVIYKTAGKASGPDWHVSLLAGAFIIPPTVMVVVLIRAVYVSLPQKEDLTEQLPSLSMMKDIVAIAKDVAGIAK